MKFHHVLVFLSLVFGLCVGFVIGHSSNMNVVTVKLGEFLDTDFVYLKTGLIMRGQVISKNEDSVLFAMDNTTLTIPANEIQKIEYNYYTRYFKGLDR